LESSLAGKKEEKVNQLKVRIKKFRLLFFVTSRMYRFAKQFAIAIRIVGARSVGVDQFENGVLSLNRATMLGRKGDLITTPLDKTIFRFIVEHGEWEPQESRYLSKCLIATDSAEGLSSKVAFVDVGANSGLVTRQVLNHSGSHCDVVLVEPIPNHVKAIEANLTYLRGNNRVQIVEVALGEVSGQSEISMDISNRGNSSFLSSAMPASDIRKLQVKTLAVEEFFKTYLSNFDNYIIKSDTQGFDSKILSLLPTDFWEKCRGAVVEVWALPEIEAISVRNLLKLWVNFSDFNWAADGSVPTNLDEIDSFWLSKSGGSKNLFLK